MWTPQASARIRHQPSRRARQPSKSTAQVAEHMRGRIAAGDWDVGRPIPGLTDLEVEYGVSFGTVRAAQQILVEEGLLSEPEQGISTRVIARPGASDSRDAAAKARIAYRALGEQLARLAASIGQGAKAATPPPAST